MLLKLEGTRCYVGAFSNINESRVKTCPGLNANEIQIPYDKHHKVSSLAKRHQNTQFCQILSIMKMSNNLAKYEVLVNQYLSSILDVSEKMTQVVYLSNCKLNRSSC